jgi:hypothetical protein
MRTVDDEADVIKLQHQHRRDRPQGPMRSMHHNDAGVRQATSSDHGSVHDQRKATDAFEIICNAISPQFWEIVTALRRNGLHTKASWTVAVIRDASKVWT